ncbi:MAG: LysR substrate-binding domain-containing protein [Alphaproteobacteria bacterium]|nr:LysR substrate-binding domain-containing protein [Alphaproteobacteria bacterium]
MRNLGRIHLSGLRAIEAVGRLGGLRAAADEIGVTVGAVSQQVQKTEQQLGRALFERHPKGLQLTPHGEAVLRHLSIGMSELSAAVTLAERRQDRGLTVSVAPVFASKWLVWRLKNFNEQHPGTRVRVDATDTLVDPNTSDVDVCIRVGTGNWPNVSASKLIDQYMFPVCSPSLAAQISTPMDLARFPIIRDQGDVFGWNIWLKPNGLDDAILGDGPTFSDGSLCLDAAIAGQGIFLAWETVACDALRFGRLVAPFPDRYRTDYAHWFVTSRHASNSRSVRDFEQWLRRELEIALAPVDMPVEPDDC